MKKRNVKPSIVTYDTLVGGYCRMRRVERAIELVDEMKREGIRSNAIVYNPIIDALAEARRFKEVLGMMEHFFCVRQAPLSPPTILMYGITVRLKTLLD
jgi:pentatricopeptide repeat protein